MKLLINYANRFFTQSQKLNSQTGIQTGGFDKVISYSPKHIGRDFFAKNAHILRQKRGNGYWLWKPYFISESLDLLKQGDFLFYCDSGAYFVNSISPLIQIISDNRQDIMPFELMYLEKNWTKRDAFILMDCDKPDYSESKQRLGGFILFRKSEFTMDFMRDFLRYSQDERIITDSENQLGYPNYPYFRENRHDQSIFSLLTKKYNLDAFRDPCQWGNDRIACYANSAYGQIIESTGKKIAGKIKRKILS